MDVVKKVNFEQIFMFIYSRRKGTIADKMENQVPEDIKHKRFNVLKEYYDNNLDKNNEKYIGTIQNVLVEGKSKNNEEMLTGRTDTNKVIVFKGKENLIGKFANVKIVSQHKWYLKGQIINEGEE